MSLGDVPAAVWSRRTWQAVLHLLTSALLWLLPVALLLVPAALLRFLGTG